MKISKIIMNTIKKTINLKIIVLIIFSPTKPFSGRADGVRFSGTKPSDTKYRGKDSRIFMQEIFAFLLKN